MVKLSAMQKLENRCINSDEVPEEMLTLKRTGSGVCGHSEEGYRGMGHTRGHG